MAEPRPMDPWGAALAAFHAGDRDAAVVIRRDDDLPWEVPCALMFRPEAEFSPIDLLALDHCRAPVLDAGAGAGRAALALQERGLAVTALDVSPEACAIMRDRGVRDVFEGTILGHEGGPYASILLLGNGIGIAGTLDGLPSLLTKLRALLAPDGVALCESLDVRATEERIHLDYQHDNERAGRYLGEIRVRFEFDDRVGPWCGWLHADAETLREHAGDAGLTMKILRREEDGSFLAALRRRESK